MKTVTFNVDGMSCSHCENAVNTALLAIYGVTGCIAKASSCEVVCTFDELNVDEQTIKNEIISTGYTVL